MNPAGFFITLLLSMGGAYVAGRAIEREMRRNSKPRWDLRETMFIGKDIGIDWNAVNFYPRDLARGIVVEMEHGTVDPRTDVTGDDLVKTAKIAWAHLNEFPDYYQRLDQMEDEAEEYWESK